MEVYDVRQDDAPRCTECGDPMTHPEDIEDGMHFLCAVEGFEEDFNEDFDEGGESG